MSVIGTQLRRWQRFSLRERILRSTFYLITIMAIIWSLRTIEIIPEFLYDAPQQTADLFARMWPVDWAWYPKFVHAALMETLHTATLGTILAVALALPVALMVARYTRTLTEPAIVRAIGAVYVAAGRLTQGERLALPMLGRSGLTDTMLGATFYDERTVEPGAVHVLHNEPTFYPVRAANHTPPQIAGG